MKPFLVIVEVSFVALHWCINFHPPLELVVKNEGGQLRPLWEIRHGVKLALSDIHPDIQLGAIATGGNLKEVVLV